MNRPASTNRSTKYSPGEFSLLIRSNTHFKAKLHRAWARFSTATGESGGRLGRNRHKGAGVRRKTNVQSLLDTWKPALTGFEGDSKLVVPLSIALCSSCWAEEPASSTSFGICWRLFSSFSSSLSSFSAQSPQWPLIIPFSVSSRQ